VFERPRSGERAVLVRLGLGAQVDPEDLQEFKQLAVSAGAQPVATVTGRRDSPDPRFFMGSGKADEVRTVAEDNAADVILGRPRALAQPGAQSRKRTMDGEKREIEDLLGKG